MPPARIDTTKPDPTLGTLPVECQKQADILRTIETELHEPSNQIWPPRPTHGAEQRRTPIGTKETHEK